jgi:hypothetical protein
MRTLSIWWSNDYSENHISVGECRLLLEHLGYIFHPTRAGLIVDKDGETVGSWDWDSQ